MPQNQLDITNQLVLFIIRTQISPCKQVICLSNILLSCGKMNLAKINQSYSQKRIAEYERQNITSLHAVDRKVQIA